MTGAASSFLNAIWVALIENVTVKIVYRRCLLLLLGEKFIFILFSPRGTRTRSGRTLYNLYACLCRQFNRMIIERKRFRRHQDMLGTVNRLMFIVIESFFREFHLLYPSTVMTE